MEYLKMNKNIKIEIEQNENFLKARASVRKRISVEEEQFFLTTEDIVKYIEGLGHTRYKLTGCSQERISNSIRGNHLQRGVWEFKKETVKRKSARSSETRKETIRTRTKRLASSSKKRKQNAEDE